MSRIPPSLFLIFCSALGCASAPAPRPAAGQGPGTAIVVDDHLGWPYRLEQVSIAVDGELLRAIDDPRHDAASVGPLDLSPERHTVTVEAVAVYPGSSPGVDCRVRLRTDQPVGAGQAPSTIHIDLRLRSEELPSGSADASKRDDCPDDVLSGAICRAELRSEEARERRDVVALLCAQDKLAALRELSSMVARDRARREAGFSSVRDAQDVIGAAEEKAALLSRQLDECVPESPAYADMPTRWVSEPVCVGQGALGWED
jgi:hypothetical protein